MERWSEAEIHEWVKAVPMSEVLAEAKRKEAAARAQTRLIAAYEAEEKALAALHRAYGEMTTTFMDLGKSGAECGVTGATAVLRLKDLVTAMAVLRGERMCTEVVALAARNNKYSTPPPLKIRK